MSTPDFSKRPDDWPEGDAWIYTDEAGKSGVTADSTHLDTALKALEVGLSPLLPAEDGSKGVDGKWKGYQTTPATAKTIRGWYRNGRTGNGLATGYGNLECLEFDDAATYDEFKAAAIHFGVDDLVERIEAGYLEETPRSGIHWLYRCQTIAGNTKLAERPTPGEPHKREVLIETRGIGGFLVIAPSCGRVHPSGKPYVLLRGGLDSIVTITPDEREALWSLARSFDEMPDPWDIEVPKSGKGGMRAQATGGFPSQGVSPGDDFNSRAQLADIIEPFGWKRVHVRGGVEYWRRPDKEQGVSATWGKTKGFRVFTTSTSLGVGSHSLLHVYCKLRHKGNWADCVKDLVELGYGTWIDSGGQERQNPVPKDWRTQNPRNGATEAPHAAPTNAASVASVASVGSTKLATTLASTIKIAPVEFLDAGNVFPLKLVALAGLGGGGKGMFWANLVADLTRGRETLGLAFAANPDPVEIGLLGCEDGYADTVVPRLMSADADLDKVHIIDGVKDDKGHLLPFSILHLRPLEEWLTAHPTVRAVIIDPVSGYIGRAGVKDHNESELRAVLEPLADLANRMRVAIITIKHLNKDEAKTVSSRVGGSVAYVNIPRACFVIGNDPDDDQKRILAPFKWNLNADRPPSLSWRMSPIPDERLATILAKCDHLSETQQDQLTKQLKHLSR